MKEQSDDREREFKFEYADDLDFLIDCMRSMATPERPLITFPPHAVMDVYFDNRDRDFFKAGSTLRLRKRRINPGWTLNFKTPPLADEHDFHDRREVITRVKVNEALGYQEQHIPGLAWQCAIELARAREFDEHLLPSVHLITWRTGWTIRPGDLGDRQSNYIYLYRDEVTAYALDGQRPDWIIQYGALDYTTATPRSVSFTGFEVESSGRSENEEARAVDAMRSVARRLSGDPRVLRITANKYQKALELLS
ncbi:CYTH domain-containing protein [Streptomyces buecherae]|uniref:CYTH domain-containing protein n=1 Tax=Streptomyces buecherae TaxID=2763006 RepID=A0A7H8N161_9ACTN|nr:CYTH domain-containing protein [Streptomyces buecherae]QKW48215.1 CYTH domain-containing protein [Streptomyces buecherae]QKW54115.1 CYTH domain-containing protein [Streptomyces buecherae]